MLNPDQAVAESGSDQAVAESGSNPDPDEVFLTKIIFVDKKIIISANPCKENSGSRRSFQPNMELFKLEISSFFPFLL